jgi:hypothetical protein
LRSCHLPPHSLFQKACLALIDQLAERFEIHSVLLQYIFFVNSKCLAYFRLSMDSSVAGIFSIEWSVAKTKNEGFIFHHIFLLHFSTQHQTYSKEKLSSLSHPTGKLH